MQQHISKSGVYILIGKASKRFKRRHSPDNKASLQHEKSGRGTEETSCISRVCCDFHCSRSFCWRFRLLLSQAYLCPWGLVLRHCRYMRSQPVRAMATFGPLVIGAMVLAGITGFLAYGCLRLNLASFGPPVIGAGVEAFTLGIPVIGDRMLGS